MDIQQLIRFDQELLLRLNGSDSLFWDGFMWMATNTTTWIPIAIALLYVIFKNNKLKESLLIILSLALVIVIADQISSGFCKPFFARFRPTQDPELMYLIDTVNEYRGGRYGFISSHAANTFAVAIFLSLVIRSRSLGLILFIWAILNAYSRIYLGVHFPGDILCGAVLGTVIGTLIYLIYRFIHNKVERQSVRITSNYTKTGYLVDDAHLMVASIYTTFVFITIYALIYIKINVL
jgi:undecaprenyl-diphosphatase